jgi:protein-tyrosine phosphatase
VPLADSETQDIKKYFAKTNAQLTEILSNKKNKVLIHCFAGKSRSTTVLVSYLMQAEKKKRDEVLQKVKEKRPIVQPNEGFMKQLLEWEKELKI